MQPESAQAGSNAVTINITGQYFTPDSVACWNGSAQLIPTAYVSPTQITAILPAVALQSAGPLSIGVYDPVRNAFATNSLIFTVVQPSNAGSSFTAMNLDGLAMAWDNTRSVLYVGTGPLDRAYPNSLVVVDPATATVKNSVGVSPFPDVLSVSAQDQFLYVGFGEATLETQLPLPGLSR